MPYISAWAIPARPIATGMSRRGLTHLLAGGRRQLDADEGVEQHRHDGDEHRPRRGEVADGDAVHAVLGAVDDDADR